VKRRFRDQVVWITGGGSGIGRTTALRFASEGAKVAVSGRRAERLESVVDDVGRMGGEAVALPLDVTDEAAIEAAVEVLLARFGRLDVALANAGFSVAGPVAELNAEDWRRQLDVNVVGAALTARYALPALSETQGRIGLVGSVAAYLCAPKLAPYNASKFAVRALGMTLSAELHGSGVSCTTVHPGFVESEIAQVDNEGHFDPAREDRRPKKLMWTSEEAAAEIVDALAKRKREHVFTRHGQLGAFIGQHFPRVAHVMLRR